MTEADVKIKEALNWLDTELEWRLALQEKECLSEFGFAQLLILKDAKSILTKH